MKLSFKQKYTTVGLAVITAIIGFNSNSYSQQENKIILQSNEECTINSSSLKSGGIQYSIQVSKTGNYYVGALVRGVEGNIINVIVDSRPVRECLNLTSDGWQSSIVSDRMNIIKKPFYLSQGTHTITFYQKNNLVPLIDKIIVTGSLANAYLSTKDVIQGETKGTYSLNVSKYNKGAMESQMKTAASDPLYDFICESNIPASYTFWQWDYGTAGQTVTWETRKQPDPLASDPVMYFFRLDDNNNVVESWSNDDGNGGYQSKISVTLPATGSYQLVVRAYSYNPNTPTTSDLYKNGVLVQSNITLAGYFVYLPSTSLTGELNYFTCRQGSGPYDFDTKLFLFSGYTTPVVAQNDDYYQPGDFNWGRKSRIKSSSTNIYYALIINYSAASPVNCSFYGKCANSDIMPYFPALKADDAIMSSPSSSNYNCISWSGGKTDLGRYFWPPEASCPNNVWWDPAGDKKSFDNFYGNVNQYGVYTPRFDGAMKYVPTTNSNESIVDLWSYTSTEPYDYTHGSVRNPGDNFHHGYDWESKPGGLARTFHPRFALGANANGSGYGYVVQYYKQYGTKSVSQPVAIGSKSVQTDVLAKSETDRLYSAKNNLSEKLVSQFEMAYKAWKNSWNEPALDKESNPAAFLKTKEYTVLSSLLNSDKKGSATLLIEKCLAGDELAGYALCKEKLFDNSDEIMNLTRSTSPQGKIASDGYMIIDTPANAWTRFIKNIISANY